MTPELKKQIRDMYNEEATDSLIYAALAKYAVNAHNREILLSMARDEGKHRDIWTPYVNEPPKVAAWKVRLSAVLAKVFGLVFVINIMESGEEKTKRAYAAIGKDVPVALKVLEDEERHEEYLVGMIKEEKLSYISSMVLGLSDALVELTGALAGFTLALNDNAMIGLAGFITGVAATLSMAASEYLAKKADATEKHPLKAAMYTGSAYLFTVVLLLLPYALTPSPLVALLFCLCNAALVIAGFTFFVSVVRRQPFLRGFREMTVISFSVALISFCIGWAARAFLSLDV
jgi:VIT1/CCC1 family predicted Fe2+/Mn2+ transporter